MDPNKPFNELPLLPPKCDLETPQILKKAIIANKEIAELKGIANLIPNQAILLQIIGLQEAKLSSEIENIVITNDELYRAFGENNVNTDPNTKEVLRYKDALWHGYNSIKKGRLLNVSLFEEIVDIITNRKVGIRKLPGTKLVNSFGEVVYFPPEGEAVIREKLDNLEKFIYLENDLDPLIKSAIIHYQFEAIHPFYDGNGRSGRIINILYLIEKKLLDLPILYLSRYIIDNKHNYYLKLRAIAEKNAWEDWILYILEAIIQTANLTKEKILSIQKIMNETAANVKEKLPKLFSKELIEIIFYYPYCKIKFLEEAKIAHRQTASLYLKELEKIGILEGIKKGREIYYINRAFLKILENKNM
ncbi:MAG: Fic family protein [Chlamydiae bacterium]|nr:Fic family protein [Chlamydiota bacterium]